MDRDLVLVGRVERYLAHFLIAFPYAHHVAQGELHALQQGSLGRVPVHLPLQDRLVLLAGFELGAVAQRGDLCQRLEARARAVVLQSGLILGRVRLDDLIVEPHVGNGHTILGEGARLVRADGRGRAQRLHRLEILHQAILRGHPFRGQREAHRDRGQQTLRHVRDDDTDQEDDSVEPMVTEYEGYDEEGHTEEYGHPRDQVDEMMNLLSDRRFTSIKAGCQAGNPSHHCLIATADHHSLRCPLNGVRGEEGEVLRLQRVLVRELGGSRLGLGFARQRAVVHFESP